MSDLKKLKDGSVKITEPVVTRCAYCGKANPIIECREIGNSTDSVLVGFVLTCCKRLLGAQMIAKAQQPPVVN